MSEILLSVVVGVYNEDQGIAEFINSLYPVMEKSKVPYEIIIVDDGSTDSTLEQLKKEVALKVNLKVIELLRNFGQVNALSAGMSIAKGEWIVMMDGDMQHDPIHILDFIEKSKSGYDLIATYREKRVDSFNRKLFTFLGNRINRFLVGIDIKDFGSAFRMFDSNILKGMKDKNGYVHYKTPQLYAMARKSIQLPITQNLRKYGNTKWTLGMFISYNMDFITVSPKLAHLMIGISVFGFFTGCTLYIFKILNVFQNVQAISAPVSLSFSSLHLIMLAVIWRELIVAQNLIKGNPPYIIRKIWE